MKANRQAEEWRTLERGDRVVVARPITETERSLLGRRFVFDRYTKPHGFAVVGDEHGAWHVHPECLDKEETP
jgi:hypothetical protein